MKPRPEQRGITRRRRSVVPPRGSRPWPAWMRITRTGWECAHPHHPEVPDSVEGLSERMVVGSALAHLDRWHPGWKIRCRRCGRRQWNDQESSYCYECRPQ